MKKIKKSITQLQENSKINILNNKNASKVKGDFVIVVDIIDG